MNNGKLQIKPQFRAQVSRKLRSLKAFKETFRFVYFLNLTFFVDFLDFLPFIVVHMYSQRVSGESGLIWRDFHSLCAML